MRKHAASSKNNHLHLVQRQSGAQGRRSCFIAHSAIIENAQQSQPTIVISYYLAEVASHNGNQAVAETSN
jgi:hypothetical protein